MDDFVRKDKKSCPQILPHIVLSVGNVIYCKQLNDPASMKTKNRNTLMSTEHFSIHQGCFYVNNRRSFCFGSFLFQIINDLPNHGNTFFFAVKTAFFHIFQDSHGKFLPALSLRCSVQKFHRHCFWRSLCRNFRGCRNEDFPGDDSVVSEENGTHRIRSMHIHLPEPVCAV